jgi:Domain of unknown function (DUF4160)
MSPTILRDGAYRFFFNSREESSMHVHVAVSVGTAKFWPEPIVALATYHGLNERELHNIEALVREHEADFKTAWREHFSK